MSDTDLALIKLGNKGTIATLIAEAAGNVGDWCKFRKLLPVPPLARWLPELSAVYSDFAF
jgi:hypothetical protein